MKNNYIKVHIRGDIRDQYIMSYDNDDGFDYTFNSKKAKLFNYETATQIKEILKQFVRIKNVVIVVISNKKLYNRLFNEAEK